MRCTLYRALGLLLLSAASAGHAGAQDLAPFDPAGDYAYDLASTAATVVEVELDRGETVTIRELKVRILSAQGCELGKCALGFSEIELLPR